MYNYYYIFFQLQGISTEQFIKDEQHSMRMHDCGVFGYRGLTGMLHKLNHYFIVNNSN